MTAFFIGYLAVELLILSRRVRAIPLRICVTGTRGKSSVTRLIAACLREAGFAVLAKTTGSKPVIIFPDGSEREIKRRGDPTILEGKRILAEAEKLRVKALVSEMMSIHPECSFIESVQMFKPHVLVITNVRLDHLEQMGRSKEEIARCFACSIAENTAVFVENSEYFSLFDEAAKKRNSKIIKVDRESFKENLEPQKEFSPFEFEENIRLALAVAEFLGIEKETALRGIKKAIPDFGSLKVWTGDFGSPSRRFFLISAFAANDPESTRAVLTNVREKIFFEKKVIALLNLRKDRGDRTMQWMLALKAGAFPEFEKIFLSGDHGYVLKRKLKKTLKAELFILKNKVPHRIMEEISEKAESDAVLVGIGNMGGVGKELVKYWEGFGQAYDF